MDRLTVRGKSPDPGIKPAENKNSGGIHIVADLSECQGGLDYMLDQEKLEEFCENAITSAGLTQVGKKFFKFPGAGITGMILLAESHLAIHTWPEKDFVTLDVYVCNVSEDNSGKARAVYQAFVDLFQPGRVNHQEIARD